MSVTESTPRNGTLRMEWPIPPELAHVTREEWEVLVAEAFAKVVAERFPDFPRT